MSVAARKSKKKESDAQRNTRSKFRDATSWAHAILDDPEKKAYYQKRAKMLKLPNAYTAAVTDYMRKPKIMKSSFHDTVCYTISKKGFTVKTVEVRATGMNSTPPNVEIRKHNDLWKVRFKRGDTMPSSLTFSIIDNTLREIWEVDTFD